MRPQISDRVAAPPLEESEDSMIRWKRRLLASLALLGILAVGAPAWAQYGGYRGGYRGGYGGGYRGGYGGGYRGGYGGGYRGGYGGYRGGYRGGYGYRYSYQPPVYY